MTGTAGGDGGTGGGGKGGTERYGDRWGGGRWGEVRGTGEGGQVVRGTLPSPSHFPQLTHTQVLDCKAKLSKYINHK